MREVTRYEANDGTVHTSEEACLMHEARDAAQEAFESWYDAGCDSTLWGEGSDGMVYSADLMTWIAKNAERLLPLVEAEIKHKPLSY